MIKGLNSFVTKKVCVYYVKIERHYLLKGMSHMIMGNVLCCIQGIWYSNMSSKSARLMQNTVATWQPFSITYLYLMNFSMVLLFFVKQMRTPFLETVKS